MLSHLGLSNQDYIRLAIMAAGAVVDYMSASTEPPLIRLVPRTPVTWQQATEPSTMENQAQRRWRCINPSMHSQHPGFSPVSSPVRCNLKFALCIDNGNESGVEHALTSVWRLHCVWLFSGPVPSLSTVGLTALPGGKSVFFLATMTWTNKCTAVR